MPHLYAPLAAPILCPACPMCCRRMQLTRIEPHGPGYDERSFECWTCKQERMIVVQFRAAKNDYSV